MKSYAGKVVVVTGASSGLGRQFALDLAKQGANVIGLAFLMMPFEAVFAGPAAAVTAMVEACRRGPPGARVDAIEEHAGTPEELNPC